LNGRASAAVRYLQALSEARAAVGPSDAELLGRFVAHRDGAALDALVRRHGPMVWGVCRRVLADHNDAEDAFQATFLVLARRAASVRPRERVGSWLYGVARQTARKARATRARRRAREGPASEFPEPEARCPRDDQAELIEHELSRLPDKYRAPVVLCVLERLTHEEAAARLGWPVGTIAGRLSRARALLAARLTRRGVATAGVAVAAAMARAETAASAGVPDRLITSTVETTGLFAAGGAEAVPAEVARLTSEVLKTMLLTKLTKTAAVAAAALLGLALAGAGLRHDAARGDEKAPAEGSFRVSVTDVIRDDDTAVTLIGLEVPRGSKVELLSDREQGGGMSFSTDAADEDRADGRFRMQLTVFADHVERKEGSPGVVKFRLGHTVGKISGSTGETVPMPAGAKQLSDVLTVPIKSGEYAYGRPTKLVTFKGVTYSLVVTGLK
jgi:RNA polymerase sigma factor (sigma-70 family)